MNNSVGIIKQKARNPEKLHCMVTSSSPRVDVGYDTGNSHCEKLIIGSLLRQQSRKRHFIITIIFFFIIASVKVLFVFERFFRSSGVTLNLGLGIYHFCCLNKSENSSQMRCDDAMENDRNQSESGSSIEIKINSNFMRQLLMRLDRSVPNAI